MCNFYAQFHSLVLNPCDTRIVIHTLLFILVVEISSVYDSLRKYIYGRDI